MKKIIFLLFISGFLFSFIFLSPDFVNNFTGAYSGYLDLGSQQLKLVFIFSEDLFKKGQFNSIFISPDQSSAMIPSSSCDISDTSIIFSFSSIKAKLTINGKNENTLNTIFTQSGKNFPITLKKMPRPQEPQRPFDYIEKEVEINNQDIKLYGTLTVPTNTQLSIEGKLPAIVLITGSGAQNRDEELLGHKPFLVLSDFLTKLGFAVLRMDDRGVGFDINLIANSTTFDFVEDIHSAIDFLKTQEFVDNKRIGVLGHSEGGLISYILASKYPDDIDFIISLAGPSLRGDKILLAQQELIGRVSGMKENDIKKMLQINSALYEAVIKYKDDNSNESLINEIKEIAKKYKLSKEDTQRVIAELTSKWMRTFITTDPADYIKDIKCPILALFGEKDLQVPAKENSELMKSIFSQSGNSKAVIMIMNSCNHLFQTAKTGNIFEYALISETISDATLKVIEEFLLKIMR